jgi:hypothetical protein
MLVEPVKINLDKERHLRLTLNAMIKFKQTTGKDLLNGFNPSEMEIEDVRALLWVSLIHEDKALTLGEVGEIVELSNLRDIIEALTESVSRAFPEKKETVDPNPPSP